jgi:RND family efflux transporter MFP subunit
MRRAYWSLLVTGIILGMAVAACAPASTPTAALPTPAPASAVQAPGSVSASAVVEPVQQSSMAFLLAAPVKQVYIKAGDVVSAGQPLVMLDTPDLEFAVTGAQAELTSAQANAALQRMGRKKWNGNQWVFVSTPPEWKQQADARVTEAQAALDAAKANLARGALMAPFDGTIVSVDVVPGEMVTPQRPVLVIGDLAHLQLATTDLSERQIAGVRVGQPATARLKAFAQDLPGKVVSIAPMAQIYNGDTVFKVTVQLDQQPDSLMWGMTGDLSIQTDK